MSTGKALLGVLAGVAAGAALGILFAPDKGTDTRKKMVNKSKDVADALNKKIDQKFDDLIATVKGKMKHSKPINDLMGSLKHEMQD